LSDPTIVPQANFERDSYDNALAADILLGSDSPVLFVPIDWQQMMAEGAAAETLDSASPYRESRGVPMEGRSLIADT
jgi:hypothetical protein